MTVESALRMLIVRLQMEAVAYHTKEEHESATIQEYERILEEMGRAPQRESRPVVDQQKLLNWVGMHADTSDPRGFTVKVNDLQNAIRAGEFRC
jgi:hypothetical protein